MINYSPTKYIMLFVSSTLLIVSFSLSSPVLAEDPAPYTDKTVTFQLRGQSMAEVAQQISEQFNYKIVMSDQLAGIQVSGNFDNVTLDDFFSRNIFRNKNIAIVYDDIAKTILIRDFGSKGNSTEYNPGNQEGKVVHIRKEDLLDIEVTPGNKLSDIPLIGESFVPEDIEVTPGNTLADTGTIVESFGPADIEITPGSILADMVAPEESLISVDIEVTPGNILADAVSIEKSFAPEDIEVTPGNILVDLKKNQLGE